MTKSVVISYADQDRTVARALRQIIESAIPDGVWVREFDLNGGELVADAVDIAIAEAKWFIILLSNKSMRSRWVKYEANLATMRAIGEDDFTVVSIRLDKSQPPKYLQTHLGGITIDVSALSDPTAEYLRLANQIRETVSTKSRDAVYVGRGDDRDRFAIAARRNAIVFILGWAGIGKTEFVHRSVPEQLHKRPLTVRLSRGHSLDLLCRQIIRRSHIAQPLGCDGSSERSDNELLQIALEALKQRESHFFLFLDNADEALRASNDLAPYLATFLEKYLAFEIRSHVVIATSRNPDLTALISHAADVMTLNGLASVYIRECLDLWLADPKRFEALIAMPDTDKVIALIDGHPLAAKMVASYFRTKTPQHLLLPTEAKRFQLKLAEYMLRHLDDSTLTDLEILILEIIAAVRQPMKLEDLLAVRELRQYTLAQVRQARLRLADLFLIQHDGELMYLHKFIEAFYHDKVIQLEDRLNAIALDFGGYAFSRVKGLSAELTRLADAGETQSQRWVELSNELFRYAVPASRMLRAAGKPEMAKQLPLEVRGTLREMVFFFYQDRRDYQTALEYSEQWLLLDPDDLEIMLYRARCLRNIGGKDGLARASAVIAEIEGRDYRRRFEARVYREKAIIEEHLNNVEGAKKFYRKGIESTPAYGYPENQIGLAQLLLREIDSNGYVGREKSDRAHEALRNLEDARSNFASFDRYHLGLYVEALIYCGFDAKAMPLLQEAIEEKPEDARLTYRMAEILRDREEFSDAEQFARRALRAGAGKAPLSLANVLYGQGMQLLQADAKAATAKFSDALRALERFRPEYGHDQEVADAIAAKVHRTMGNWSAAKARLDQYSMSVNYYTVYEQTRVDLWEADQAENDKLDSKAAQILTRAIDRIKAFRNRRPLSQPLAELLETSEARLSQIRKRRESLRHE